MNMYVYRIEQHVTHRKYDIKISNGICHFNTSHNNSHKVGGTWKGLNERMHE